MISVILMVLQINGALFIGMLATTLIALVTGQLHFPKMLMDIPALPEGMLITNPFAAFGDVFSHHLYAVVFSFLLVTIFDTTGTMIGVAEQAGLMKKASCQRYEEPCSLTLLQRRLVLCLEQAQRQLILNHHLVLLLAEEPG